MTIAGRLRLAQHRYRIAVGGERMRRLRELRRACLAALRADIRRAKRATQ